MIRSSFQMIPGIGAHMEQRLWASGVVTWDELRGSSLVRESSRDRRAFILSCLEILEEAYRNRDAAFFAAHLPKKEWWRLYGDFRRDTGFLDIETTGLSHYYDQVTMVGLYQENAFRAYTKDHDLSEVADDLKRAKILVTFNGTLFDLKFISRDFGDAASHAVHIDLRHQLRSLGLTGGLKVIEEELGVARSEETEHVDGRGAVVLWNRFLAGDQEALEQLLHYNAEDTMNLQYLMDYVYNERLKAAQELMNSNVRQQRIARRPARGQRPNPLKARRQSKPLRKVTTTTGGKLRVRFAAAEVTYDPSKVTRAEFTLDDLLARIPNKENPPRVVGIDLTGSEARPSGYCELECDAATLDILHTDEEMVQRIAAFRPDVVSIDSPLSLPAGRCCTSDECSCREHGIMRECERVLKRRGINVYPALIQSMQALTARGIRLATALRAKGIDVIESYPGAAQDILQFPRKRIDLGALTESLKGFGLRLLETREKINHDEIDALTSALVGYFYLADDYEGIGDESTENLLIIPNVQTRTRKGGTNNECQPQSSSAPSSAEREKERLLRILPRGTGPLSSSAVGGPTQATL